jgi:Nif-specific regulatory protein
MTHSLIRENRILSALLEVSKVLNSSFDLEKNLSLTMHVLGDFLEMERGSVFLLDHNTKELRIVAAHGLTKEQIEKGRYRIGEGIVGRVLEMGSPMVIPNVGEEPLFLNKTGARIGKNGISFLCVPIKFKGKSIGVLSVDRIFKDKTITINEDIRVLEIVASIIAQYVILWKHYRESEQERENLKLELRDRYSLPNIIGSSDKMQEVFEAVRRVAHSKATVLLYGESGTGKELIAKAIHYMSPRAKWSFVKFNCASIPEGLLESELFGHEKGAFTGAITSRKGRFELANGGTILLDEIGDLPINVVPIFMPPLRQRKEDISFLIEHFIKRFNEENNKNISISPDALRVFIDYNWPGNVRELENTIERLVVMSLGTTINSSDLPINLKLPTTNEFSQKESLKTGIEEIEKSIVLDALEKTGWIQAKAARMIGITPRQIGYKIKKYGIDKQNSLSLS